MALVSAALPACAPRDADVVAVVRPVDDDQVAFAMSPSTANQADGAPGAMREVRWADNPRRLLNEAFRAAAAVESARMTFHRQERLGLFKSLQPAERMVALCRESPFSVLFTWLDDDSEFSQCLFIEAANDGAVLLYRRKGLFGGSGGVVAFPPELGVVFQKAKLPITEFGPRRVMAALHRRIDAAEAFGGVDAEYAGRVIVGPADELCDHITLAFPDQDAYAAKRVELYLHAETHLPVMIELWLPDRGGDATAALDARYIFAESQVNVSLTGDDFQLDAQKTDGGGPESRTGN
ncbi:MAG: DUF1571 domain-containing protein [Phycisphaerales bacterium]|nr:DUF1571 domain-containing protein [Phycisphaerales bacterium]MCB9863435.1 DUF1571 domain-containing protein [Phycisphaerales bacterium]